MLQRDLDHSTSSNLLRAITDMHDVVNIVVYIEDTKERMRHTNCKAQNAKRKTLRDSSIGAIVLIP